MMFHRICRITGVMALALLPAAGVAAQDEAPARPAGPQPGDLLIDIGATGRFQFDADVDAGGEFSLNSYAFDLGLRAICTDEFSIGLNVGYTVDDYDFGGSAGIGAIDPWDDIHTLEVRLDFTCRLNDDWTLFAGPIAVFARESGAEFDESDSYGGFFGASYRASSEVTVGAGLGVMDRLEDDDPRIFPIIILDWRLTPEWRLTSTSEAMMAGIEAVCTLDETMEAGLGVGYAFSRFRLDDRDIAPDGIGENTALVVQARFSIFPDPDFRISAVAGVFFDGELEIEDEDGMRLFKDDYDPAYYVGGRISVTF